MAKPNKNLLWQTFVKLIYTGLCRGCSIKKKKEKVEKSDYDRES